MKKKDETFRFHPPEISQLKSIREGHEVLNRNGFACLYIDYGFRSLMAFKTIVGEKPVRTSDSLKHSRFGKEELS